MVTKVKPLSLKTWKDFETLFGANGACGGCWCMWWRMKRSQFAERHGPGNKRVMKSIVRSGNVPGIIVYDGNVPFGWCSIAPREEFLLLENSKVLARVDSAEVWSIVCFFIHRNSRRKGLLEDVIRSAVGYARRRGARIIEAYPVDIRDKTSATFIYTGVPAPFKKAGFVEVLRRSKSRPIMRYYVGKASNQQ